MNEDQELWLGPHCLSQHSTFAPPLSSPVWFSLAWLLIFYGLETGQVHEVVLTGDTVAIAVSRVWVSGSLQHGHCKLALQMTDHIWWGIHMCLGSLCVKHGPILPAHPRTCRGDTGKPRVEQAHCSEVEKAWLSQSCLPSLPCILEFVRQLPTASAEITS